MRINGFRCDQCKKEHLLEPTLIVEWVGRYLPAQWVMVSQNGNAQGDGHKEPWLFCSWLCLQTWVHQQGEGKEL